MKEDHILKFLVDDIQSVPPESGQSVTAEDVNIETTTEKQQCMNVKMMKCKYPFTMMGKEHDEMQSASNVTKSASSESGKSFTAEDVNIENTSQ